MFLDVISDMVMVLDGEWKIIWANKVAVLEAGVPADRVVGRVCYELWHGRDDFCDGCPVRAVFAGGRTEEGDVAGPKGNVWYVRAHPVKDGAGKTVGVVEIAANVTERQRALEALKESEELYKSLVRTSPESVTVSDLEGRITHVSERALVNYGTDDPHDLIGKSAFELIVPDQRETALANLRRTLAEGVVEGLEYDIFRKDGSTYAGELSTSIVRDGRGNPKGFIATIRDVTERKRAEVALRESEARYRAIFDRSINCVFIHDFQGNFLDANDAALNLLGYQRHEIESLNLIDIIEESQVDAALEAMQEILGTGFQRRFNEFKMRRKDGGEVYVETEGTLLFRGGRPYAIQGTARDITDRKLAQRALWEDRELLAVTLRSIGDGVIATDIGDRILLMNKAAESLTGWGEEEASGRPFGEIFRLVDERTHEPAGDAVRKVIEGGGVVTMPARNVLLAKNGTERAVACSGSPIRDRGGRIIGAVIVFSDITETRKMEEELQRAQKLESIGVLAGGIAHDFNNILTAVLGNLSLARLHAKPGDELHELLAEAAKAASIAKDLTFQLLTFSKGGAPIKKVASIEELLVHTTDFALRGSNVRGTFDIQEDLWSIECDIGQIAQVIHNLVINAKQAMPDGGTVEVAAKNVVIGEADRLPLKAGPHVRLSIRDHGVGIEREHIPMIFDPYFTTKQRGVGLGLTTTYTIVSRHGGYIQVESKVGSGTVFDVYLPSTGKKSRKSRSSMRDPRQEKGRGRVLLMDDEELVRRVAGTLLRSLGYDVVEVAGGVEMIEAYVKAREGGTPFDAVIMDLTVPGGMGGKEAIVKLLEIDPSARAIVSSGYSNDPVMAHYRKHGFKGVVAKPYEIDELSETLQRVLTEDT
jgi:PAS domain S-box-containing protein